VCDRPWLSAQVLNFKEPLFGRAFFWRVKKNYWINFLFNKTQNEMGERGRMEQILEFFSIILV
jgi:hypothetical protein